MWVRSSVLIVMITDGWILFRLDTGNHSSQLVPPILYSHTSLASVTAKETKSLQRVAVDDLFSGFFFFFASYHSVSSPSRWMRSDLCHLECPQFWSFTTGIRETGIKWPVLGKCCCWHLKGWGIVVTLSHLCLKANMMSIHWFVAAPHQYAKI